MIDVSAKTATAREALASATVSLGAHVLALIENHALPKGDPRSVARLAGILAAKRTAELIPLCHPLPIDAIEVDVDLVPPGQVIIRARVGATARTGVEMEALTAASVAALTVYDMCKGHTPGAIIGPVQLEAKHGGVHGDYVRDKQASTDGPSGQ